MGQRDKQIFPGYGQFKYSGGIGGPVFPSNSVPLLGASYGKDGGQGRQTGGYGVTIMTTTGSATTSTAAVTSGQVAHGDGPQISYTATVLTDTNAAFTSAIIGSTVETFSGKTGVISAQTATTVTVASWATGTPATGESYNIGPTTLPLAAVAGMTAGTSIIQIDVNNTTTPTTAEVRKITNIATLTVTLDHPLFYAHLTAAPVVVSTGVTPLYKHYFVPGNTLDSLTLEKNLGGYQSEQFSGCRVTKHTLKCAATNTVVDFMATVEGAATSVLATPTALAIVDEAPFVFAEATITAFGTVIGEIESLQVDLENAVKPVYTLNGTHNPQAISPTSRKASGQMVAVFTSLNDAVKGYFAGLGVTGGAPFVGAIDATFTHPTLNTSYQVHLNRCRISKYADDLKTNDIIHANLGFEAEFDLSAVPNSLGYASVTSGAQYVPY